MGDSQRRKGDTVTRTYKIIRIDPHLRRKVILIYGEATVQVSDSLCRQIIAEEIKEFHKAIRLDAITESTNTSNVLEEILDKCPYIEDDLHPSLMNAIDAIKNRKYNENGLASQTGRNSREGGTPTFPDYFEEDESLIGIDSDMDFREITMESLEYYVELLYEQLQDKVKGSRCIARLVATVENLSDIYEHESALNALFRTLREDYKNSIDLTTNILAISLSFATYRIFHPIFVTNKICSLIVDIVEFELMRFDKWVNDVHERKKIASNPQSNSAKHIQEYERRKAGLANAAKRQDVLLRSGFEVIRLLAETPAFMKEIMKRGIVKLLMDCLERKSTELMVTVVSFLKVMSTFKEATLQMSTQNIIEVVQAKVDENSYKALLPPLMGLLFNLSFNTKLRHKMLKYDLLQKTVTLLRHDDLQQFCIPLLYNFSMDERIRPKFSSTGIIECILLLITQTPQDSFNVGTRALLLNLSSSKRCCQIICADGGLSILLRLAFQYEDTLLLKVVRKISEQEGPTKRVFIDFASDIAGAIRNAPNQEFALECIGTLGNLENLGLDFRRIIRTFDLIPWLKSKLQFSPTRRRGQGEDRSLAETTTIEVVIFIGTCAGDEQCACYLIQEEILDSLVQLCLTPNIDTDTTIQILFAFYKFCSHVKSRKYIVGSTDIPHHVIDFLRHDFTGIREAAESILNTFTQLEHDEIWQNRVKEEKFKAYNKAWVDETKINNPAGDNTVNLLPAYQRHQLELYHPPSAFYEDEFEHPDSGRSKLSSSSASGNQTLSDTETEDETEDEEDSAGELNQTPSIYPMTQHGIPTHPSKSIFDRFEHQFRQERGAQDSYEYGISEEDDEGSEYSERNGSNPYGLYIPNISSTLDSSHGKYLKTSKIPALGNDLQSKLGNEPENGLQQNTNLRTEQFKTSPRKGVTNPALSVEL